jgi:hypothetical protein
LNSRREIREYTLAKTKRQEKNRQTIRLAMIPGALVCIVKDLDADLRIVGLAINQLNSIVGNRFI